jgi:ketosteroid isomerase-like protein
MKMQWLMATICVLLAGSAMARDTSQDEHSILRAEAAICEAYESSDGDAVRNRLDDGYTLTDSKGVVTGRDKNVNDVARRDPVYVMFRNHDQKVRLYGDAAVVTGITSQQGHTGGGATFDGDYAYTAMWVYREGRWKLAASHVSLLPKK